MTDITIIFSQFSFLFKFIYFFVFGSCIGSFINVVVYRIPLMMEQDYLEESIDFLQERDVISVFKRNNEEKISLFGRSKCPNCNMSIPLYYNIPIVGWMILKGKSACCKQKISVQYPLVELFFAMVFAFSFAYLTLQNAFIICFLFTILFSISYIDAKHLIIPDSLNTIFLWSGLIYSYFFSYNESFLIASLFGFLLIFVINFLGQIFLKKDAFGFGDAKLLAGIGAWLSLYNLSIVCILSSFIVLFYGLTLKKEKCAFGPSLCISFFTVFIYNTIK